MRRPRSAAAWAALLVVAPVLLSPLAPAAALAPSGPAPTLLLVGFERDAAAPLQGLAALGATVVRTDGVLDFAVVQTASPEAFTAAARALRGVAYVEPDFPMESFAEAAGPDAEDELMPQQWGLAAIRAPQAWPLVQPRSGPTAVAILDTGADWHHPDLADAVWNGNGLHGDDLTLYASLGHCALQGIWVKDCFYFQRDPEEVTGPMDFHGHGTHVAGIAGATRGDGGMAGVAPASLRIVKVLPTGNSFFSFVDVVATGIALASNEGARVISMSLGCWCLSLTLERAVHHAYSNGALIVAAAGNADNTLPAYPASYREVVSVMAVDQTLGRWFIEPGVGSNYGPTVDLAAPGADILSARARWTANFGFYWVGLGWKTMSGTSMATPHVAGVAALIWNANPDLRNDEVRAILEGSAKDLGQPGRDDTFGFGLVDAEAAVKRALDEGPSTQT